MFSDLITSRDILLVHCQYHPPQHHTASQDPEHYLDGSPRDKDSPG